MVTPYSRLRCTRRSSTIFLAPTSIPRVGSETKRTSGLRVRALGDADLLLVSSGETSRELLRAGAADVEIFNHLEGMFPHVFGVHHLEKGTPEKLVLALHGLHHDIQLNGLIQQQPEAPAVFRYESHAAVESRDRIVKGDFFAIFIELSRGGGKSHNAVGDANFAVPRQPSQAEDFSFANLQRNPLYLFPGICTQRFSMRRRVSAFSTDSSLA